ncbi:ActS/PrrB/RegB family redox-sensitive histidine kinase [Candidatus Pelagibacter sp.]|nr:ActS/PrrB/RegB family redox-sensitive histidine kinase [Candidatus Pelagibacter sp.]MDA9663296.1 ActS/PrrB/RegB family redox-sensitive histidine kinase [Candidatus Pelagibacter sp.]
MKFFETSKNLSLNKPTYINLRWIAIIGQLITISSVKFIFGFDFDFILANFIIFIGIISNIYLLYIYKENYLLNKLSLLFLNIDIFQLSFLLYLTGGITNPFVIFLILPCVFSSTNLDIRTNLLLLLSTTFSIIFLTFFHKDLPIPMPDSFHNNIYYLYAIPFSLLIALYFLNYFGLKFGIEANIKKEALNKMEEILAKEQELLSLGGQAAAAAHSFGTPFSTIKIIAQDLKEQLKDDKILKKDIELLISQVNRCNDILKKLTLNPTIEDEFIYKNTSIRDTLVEITKSFEEISNKNFFLNFDRDENKFNFFKSIEIIYGLRNFIGNANKFSKKNIYISVKSNIETTVIVIEDDGSGFPKDILNKIGEPYIKPIKSNSQSGSGLGLGIFIGKTLLEKNYAKIIFKNSDQHNGAKITISWKNSDLISV